MTDSKDINGEKTADDSAAQRQADGTFGKGNTIGHRFTPGDPRAGRKPGPDLITMIGKALADNEEEGAKELVDALRKLVRKGDVQAIKLVLDRLHGKAKITQDVNVNQTLQLYSSEAGPDDWDDPADTQAVEAP